MNHPASSTFKSVLSKSKPFSRPLQLVGNAHLPPSELPVPNAEEVARFQSLFLARFGVELAEEDAHDQARRLVQFVFLMQYALPYLNEARTEYKAENKKEDLESFNL